jgi:hypothetical protein
VKEQLAKLNGIVHPAVKNFDHWLENHSKDSFILYEAILFEEVAVIKKCLNHSCCPGELRIKRNVKDQTTQSILNKNKVAINR